MQPFPSLCAESAIGFKRCFLVCLGHFQLAFLRCEYAFVRLLTNHVLHSHIPVRFYKNHLCSKSSSLTHAMSSSGATHSSEEFPQNLQTAQVMHSSFRACLDMTWVQAVTIVSMLISICPFSSKVSRHSGKKVIILRRISSPTSFQQRVAQVLGQAQFWVAHSQEEGVQ